MTKTRQPNTLFRSGGILCLLIIIFPFNGFIFFILFFLWLFTAPLWIPLWKIRKIRRRQRH